MHFVPAHPVAGTENSGPDAGFAELFVNRWCILTPEADTDTAAVERLKAFWSLLGANVERPEMRDDGGGRESQRAQRIRGRGYADCAEGSGPDDPELRPGKEEGG